MPADCEKHGSTTSIISRLTHLWLPLVLVLVAGACVVSARQVSPQPREASGERQQSTRSTSAADSATQPDDASPDEPKEISCPALPAIGTGDQSGIIPLRPGLAIVDAWHSATGDYEMIERVESTSVDSVRLHLSAPDASGVNYNEVFRSICRTDLHDARVYNTGFGNGEPEIFPGTTLFSLSQAVLNDLKTKGKAILTYRQRVDESDDEVGSTASRRMEGSEGFTWDEWSGEIARVEAADVQVPVIVNNQRENVPAIHAKGTLGKLSMEFWVADDPLNPVTLQFIHNGTPFSIQVVEISFPETSRKVEEALRKKGRTEVHGIYFDFNSADIRPESEMALKEIAESLARNPSWKLRVEGHTDNIGTSDFNMDLSQRRAEAVKEELVTNYNVAASRLTTQGFGASQPKESNDTLEGRARNRRVELVRQ